jgi:hypothetical protein
VSCCLIIMTFCHLSIFSTSIFSNFSSHSTSNSPTTNKIITNHMEKTIFFSNKNSSKLSCVSFCYCHHYNNLRFPSFVVSIVKLLWHDAVSIVLNRFTNSHTSLILVSKKEWKAKAKKMMLSTEKLNIDDCCDGN